MLLLFFSILTPQHIFPTLTIDLLSSKLTPLSDPLSVDTKLVLEITTDSAFNIIFPSIRLH
jgi:hypothetical protein